ncbi:MAG: hypothetical protein HYZ26_04220 [Chloroflexi bacterium]|nr:hypothetical protein [Chloroflexota bacterium]
MSEQETPEIPAPPTRVQVAIKRLEDWLVWVIITGIAWIAGLVLAVALLETALSALPAALSLPLARLLGGALLGLVQWAYLLRGRAKLLRFLAASALAWPLALLAYDLILGASQSPLLAGLGGLAGGAVMGAVQMWAILEADEKRIWLASSVPGWVAALALGRQAVFDEVAPLANTWQYSLPLGIGWVFLAMLAVVAIVLVFPRQKLSGKDMKLPMWPKR